MSQITRPGALSVERMNQQLVRASNYRAPADMPALRHAGVMARLWGGPVTPLMANAEGAGRYAGAPLQCPATACTAAIHLDAGAQSSAWRNPEAIECLVCVEGSVEVRIGRSLDQVVTLGEFDMISIPANVKVMIKSGSHSPAKVLSTLSIPAGGSYAGVFDAVEEKAVPPMARSDLDLRFDADQGKDVDAETMAGRTTRRATLVPYKKDLNRTGGLPSEATESLSAGSVYPLIVPQGHIGRSRTAPMYGNQGLYISIAECTAGDDGPPPHAHSDTQESFYVLNGSFDICTGFDNESFVSVKTGDIFAVPSKVMRTFRNTSGKPAHLLVIIQGPDRMQDTVSFSRHIGEDFVRRFGADIIAKYAEIRMTFDAEERCGA